MTTRWDPLPDQASGAESMGSLVKWLFMPAVVVGAICWLVYVVRAPYQRLGDEQIATLEKPRFAVAGVLQRHLVKESETNSDSGLNAALDELLGRHGEIVIDLRSDPLGLFPSDKKVSKDKSAVLRIDPRGGNNLVIYMRKSDFEIVPYPDRNEFVRGIGKAWCDNTGEDSHWFLPSVYIEDIRTGDLFAKYDCVHWSDVLH